MHEAPAIIGTCINCIAPGSLNATLTLLLFIAASIALTRAAEVCSGARRDGKRKPRNHVVNAR